MNLKQIFHDHWLLVLIVPVVSFVFGIFIIAGHDMLISSQNADKSNKQLITISTDCSFVKGWFVTPQEGQWLKSNIYEFAKQRAEELKCP